jgi:2-hydroxy-3-keto-5-methylthiopentenyl-1-phosphate phosphatase
MAATDLKALRFPFKDPKFIFFTDFDGTITLKDSNDFMVRHSFLQTRIQQN